MIKEWDRTLLALVFILGVIAVVAFISSFPPLIISVIFPLIFLLIILSLYSEPRLSVDSVEREITTRTRTEIELRFTINVNGGLGFYIVNLPAPENCTLTGGSNVHLIYANGRARRISVSYKMKILRRGIYNFTTVGTVYYPVNASMRILEGNSTIDLKIKVLPEMDVPDLRSITFATDKPIPRELRSTFGPMSNDFESVRTYQIGDSYKTINWKATARSTADPGIMINQFYKEGYQSFLMLMDMGYIMVKGTEIENALEYSISFTVSLARALLAKGQDVSFSTLQYSEGQKSMLKKLSWNQNGYHEMLQDFMEIERRGSPKSKYTLDTNTLFFIRKERPAIIIPTSVLGDNTGYLSTVLQILRPYTSNIVLLDIISAGIVLRYSGLDLGRKFVQKVVTPTKRDMYRRLSSGATIVSWDPSSEKISSAIIRVLRGIGH
ncbi:MAG: DUF58 domain-containing protein [Thermoplasmataceae archaeon]|jgi:uncharacterized protein (DUF58 family)